MINQKCSVITDNEGFVGFVRKIDDSFIYVEIGTAMVVVPVMRIKSITYGLEAQKHSPPPVEERQPSRPEDRRTIHEEDNHFLESVSSVLSKVGLDKSRLQEIDVDTQPLANVVQPIYSQLKKQNLNEFIPNKKPKQSPRT